MRPAFTESSTSRRYSIAVSRTGRPARLTFRFGEVDHQLPPDVGLRWLALPVDSLPEGGPDSRRQLRGREGLDDVVVGATVEGLGNHILLPVRGQEDDRNVRLAMDRISFISWMPSVPGSIRSSSTRCGAIDSMKLIASAGSPVTTGAYPALVRASLKVSEGLRIVVHRQDSRPLLPVRGNQPQGLDGPLIRPCEGCSPPPGS